MKVLVVIVGLCAASSLVLSSVAQGVDDSSTLPTVTVVDSDGNASESGANSGRFRVTRTGNTGATLTVHYSLSGSAAKGADYATLPGNVTIPAGSSSATILINTIDDSLVEGDENVVLTLSPDAAYVIGSPSSATVDMEDNDSLASGSLALVRLRVASQTDDKIMTLSWDSEAGRRYLLQGKTDWNAVNWSDVGDIITATNGTTIASQAINPDQQRFYRLVLLP
jgi:hypothetical protein